MNYFFCRRTTSRIIVGCCWRTLLPIAWLGVFGEIFTNKLTWELHFPSLCLIPCIVSRNREQKRKEKCASRESNPGQYRGRVLWYHYTRCACSFLAPSLGAYYLQKWSVLTARPFCILGRDDFCLLSCNFILNGTKLCTLWLRVL